MIKERSKKIITYLLIVCSILVALSQILPWTSITIVEEDDTLWSPGTSHIYPWGGFDDSLVFPMSLITLFFLIYATIKTKNDLKKSGKLCRGAGIFGFLTLGLFYYFRDFYISWGIPSKYFDWGLGIFLFLVSSILFIVLAIFIYYKSKDNSEKYIKRNES